MSDPKLVSIALTRRQAVLLEETVRKSAVTGNDATAWGALYADVVRACKEHGVEVQGPLE